MDHTKVTSQRCDSCHNGAYLNYGKNNGGAKMKSPTHIPTTADCLSCHTTQSWAISHASIHAGVTTGCATCHNGTFAPGKSSYAAGHPITSDACETCHSIDNAFKCASAYDKVKEFLAVWVNKAKIYTGTRFA
jgi:nitrate/TMAO reductase-like tetraheme cytochrome c subunit